MDRRVTSPTWGPPPPCKQALSLYVLFSQFRSRDICLLFFIAQFHNNNNDDHLSSCVSERNMLLKHQSGFLSLHSPVSALLVATDNCAFYIDS